MEIKLISVSLTHNRTLLRWAVTNLKNLSLKINATAVSIHFNNQDVYNTWTFTFNYSSQQHRKPNTLSLTIKYVIHLQHNSNIIICFWPWKQVWKKIANYSYVEATIALHKFWCLANFRGLQIFTEQIYSKLGYTMK